MMLQKVILAFLLLLKLFQSWMIIHIVEHNMFLVLVRDVCLSTSLQISFTIVSLLVKKEIVSAHTKPIFFSWQCSHESCISSLLLNWPGTLRVVRVALENTCRSSCFDLMFFIYCRDFIWILFMLVKFWLFNFRLPVAFDFLTVPYL